MLLKNDHGELPRHADKRGGQGFTVRQRVFDITFASVGLALYGPFFLIAAVMIVLEDGRPIFFLQHRAGRHRKLYRVVKLRTMRNGAITKVGRWLRLTGLDETIQFVNVLTGSMRMVGPRPLTIADIERLGWDSSEFDARFYAPPGITGLAQLFGGHSARHSLALDHLYFRRSSLWLDFQLIGLSFAANVIGKRRVCTLCRRYELLTPRWCQRDWSTSWK